MGIFVQLSTAITNRSPWICWFFRIWMVLPKRCLLEAMPYTNRRNCFQKGPLLHQLIIKMTPKIYDYWTSGIFPFFWILSLFTALVLVLLPLFLKHSESFLIFLSSITAGPEFLVSRFFYCIANPGEAGNFRWIFSSSFLQFLSLFVEFFTRVEAVLGWVILELLPGFRCSVKFCPCTNSWDSIVQFPH